MLWYHMHHRYRGRSLDPQDKGPHSHKCRRCPHHSPGRQHSRRNIQTCMRKDKHYTQNPKRTCLPSRHHVCKHRKHYCRFAQHTMCHCKPSSGCGTLTTTKRKSNRCPHRSLHRIYMGLRTRTGYRCPHRSASRQDTDHSQHKARRNRDRSKGPPSNCPQHR